jgi:Methylase involved in ubiquinone/menaquinone biosynthesis
MGVNNIMNFDIASITWDDEKRRSRAKLIAEEINKSIQIKKQYTALEFGCGTGLISFCLNDKFEMITLVDTSKGMVDVLNSKIKTFEINNMKAYQMDINEKHTLPENSYEVIYTSMALHHIIDTETTIRNLYRLLKKDGYLCIIDLDEEDGSFHKEEKDFNGHNGFNQNDLKNVLLETGLKDVEANTFYEDEKVVEEMNVKYSLFLMVGRK